LIGIKNGFVVTDYQVDPYLNTPAGTIATRLANVTGASGSISNNGILTLDLTGRTARFQFFQFFGEQEWIRNDSSTIRGGTGNYELFTTADSSNINPSNPPDLNETINGRNVGDVNSDGILDAILVSAGNIGDAWGPFTGTPYAEVYNINLVRGGPTSPRIVLDIEVPDGTEQECSEEGGSIIELVAEVTRRRSSLKAAPIVTVIPAPAIASSANSPMAAGSSSPTAPVSLIS